MILPPSPANIEKAVALIRAGGLVAFPTETVYGLGADATNEEAVRRIFIAKGRPSYDPLIVHVATPEQIQDYADLSDRHVLQRFNALNKFWPGPLSLVLPLKGKIAPSVTAGLQSVAFRIPNHPIALSLLNLSKLPISAPSANQFTYVSPTTALHVEESLGKRVEIILDGGQCSVGIESTVLSLASKEPTILRPGYITKAMIEEVIGPVQTIDSMVKRAESKPQPAPGMLDIHYSPKTKLALLNGYKVNNLPSRVGTIIFDPKNALSTPQVVVSKAISSSGDLEEIAASLYESIRELDKLKLDLILIDSCPVAGFGEAIMDRIRRAVHK